jgi:hypothetical protein
MKINKTFENDKVKIECSSEKCINSKFCDFEALSYSLRSYAENCFLCPHNLEKCFIVIKPKKTLVEEINE